MMPDSTERGSCTAAPHEEQQRNLFHSVLATLRDEKRASGVSGAATEATGQAGEQAMLPTLGSPAASAAHASPAQRLLEP